MKVRLDGFRCYYDQVKEFDFPDQAGSITLIQGTSGSGKTTIFEAIYWCLFGSLRGVYHPLHANRKCCVTITLTNPSMIVMRSTRPTGFSVEMNGKVHTDQPAIELIKQVFGDKDIWLSSSYLSQGSRCHWLDLSADDRLQVIERIVYSDQAPDAYLSRATDYLNQITTQMNNAIQLYGQQLAIYSSKEPFEQEYVIEPSQLKLLERELVGTSSKVQELQSMLQQQMVNIGRLNQLRDQIQDIDANLGKIQLWNKESLDQLHKELESSRQSYAQIQSIQRQNDAYLKARALYLQLDPNSDFEKLSNKPTVRDIIQHEIGYDNFIKRSKELNSLPSYLSTIVPSKLISDIAEQEKWNQKQYLLNNLAQLVPSLPQVSVEDVDQRIRELERVCQHSYQCLECPKCQEKLELKGSQLIVYNHPSPQELIGLKDELKALTNYKRIKQSIDQLERQINAIVTTEVMNPNHNIGQLKQLQPQVTKYIQLAEELSKLEGSPYSEAPKFNSKLVQAYYNMLALPLPQDVPVIDLQKMELDAKRLVGMETDNKRYQMLERQRIGVEEQLKSLNISIDNSLESQIEQLNHDIVELKQRITKHKYANSLSLEMNKLNEQYDAIGLQTTQQFVASKLVSLIEQTEYHLLETTIANFNQTLSEVVATLFEDPISVKLDLWKNTKNRTKPNIHLNVSYRGIESSNTITGLSGGESGRLSIALLIAFYIIYPSPFVLIDESLSNINHQLRELSLVSLKRFISSPIIMILHETSSEGLFDHIISLA